MTDQPTISLTRPGAFVVGCNYWASHAGTAMWRDWQPTVVEADLRQLAGAGLQLLRVFPLWPDFQPLTLLRTGHGRPAEYRFGEAPLPPDELGQAGVSAEMLDRFAAFADLAQANGLKLLVGLVTGWMSGRLFVPPALEGLNVLTDPTAIMWQVRLVRTLVRRFRTHPAIAGWDLGNECNCMAPVPGPEAAWVWTAALTNAIRAEDATRPIVSGMHSLSPDPKGHWPIRDQAELNDVLTTHPYPIFTPHCDRDPVNTLRPCLHATAESRLYADVGGKPCLAEELGTLGPMIASEDVAAAYVRTVLFSLWAHDCHGLLWWCAYDQLHLEHAPYDWHAYERELGLLRGDRTAKPVLAELTRFRALLDRLHTPALPPRRREAVCLLAPGQDAWGVGFAAFILAKQAGFDLEFQYTDQPLRPAALYLMPSVCGANYGSRRFWLELLRRVEGGATLYLSHDDCFLTPFTAPFGVEVETRERRTRAAELRFGGVPGAPAFSVGAPIRLRLRPRAADVMGTEADGNPVFTRARHGAGCIYFLAVPLEKHLTQTAGSFHAPDAPPAWRVYASIAAAALAGRVVRHALPQLGLTEHELAPHRRVVVAINYSPVPADAALTLAAGWRYANTWHGPTPTGWHGGAERAGRLALPANDAAVFTLTAE